MRILWNSSTPIGTSGYGICTRELASRAKADGHFVRVATKHPYFGWHSWDGIEVFDGVNYKHLINMMEEERFDYIFTHWDVWVLQKRRYPKEKWVGYVPIDTEWISDDLAEVTKDIGQVVALTKHGKREFERIGIKDVMYAPHGVDTKVFKPSPEGRKRWRDEYNLTDENFVIGSVGLNYPDDRKGFIQLLRAFKVFHGRHPEARLYLHTHAPGVNSGTINYIQVVRNLGLSDYVGFPHQPSLDLNRITDDWLADIYNGFDVFCLATKGEGFGMPLIEAPACGVPVITTNTTSGQELAEGIGWLIDVDDDCLRWLPSGTWRYEPKPSEILKCLELAYSAWKNSDYQKIKDKARARGLMYDWDRVWGKYWRPVFKVMEDNLVIRKQKEAQQKALKEEYEKKYPDMDINVRELKL